MRGRPTWPVAALVGMACVGLGDNFKELNVQLDHAVVRGGRAPLARPSDSAGST